MKIKECYVSSNGISCITDINSLVNLKKNNLLNTLNKLVNKNNIIFYLTMRCSEYLIIKILSNNNFYIKFDDNDDIFNMISFS